MKLEEVMENMKVFVDPLENSGCYTAQVVGTTPTGEAVRLEIELSKCYTHEIMHETLCAKLEEIFSCQYHYEIGDIDPEDILYDGGTFK